MEKKLAEALRGEQDNYILPFLWLHGEESSVLAEEIEHIYQSGIKALCVESRPHEDFCGDDWWEDMDLILREAQKRSMKVWLLDDKHFPTGYANGLIKKKYPALRKWHIMEEHIDVVGPIKSAAILIRASNLSACADNEDSLLCAIACKRTGIGEELSDENINLSSLVKGSFLYWDIPEGYYRVFFIYKTRNGAGHKEDYIHMIDPASVDVLIEAVYEPHYQHYKEHFGKTFAGFFSDEPCFGNASCNNSGPVSGFYESTLGIPDLALPWRDDLVEMLSNQIGEDARLLLPGLWYKMGTKTSSIRYAYMDNITKLYSESFSQRLGQWCRARGVEYIGHIIEDMNAHARLGCSAGHFYRSMDGQDMAGIDVVLHQIVPGFDALIHAAPCAGGKADPAFFNYMLAKMASSHSHIQPRMKGRAMCEMFGAYGWAEGLPLMKWLTDHMLVRGINHFVPHAFSPKYPDPDCPPHFYARGENPQFSDFAVLMEYMNKMSHLFSDGYHVATAAVLYHAEAEWSGGAYMYTQVIAKELYDHQIDYDIIPIDTLISEAQCINGKLAIHHENYDCVIVPYAQILPSCILYSLSHLASLGLHVIFIDALPAKSAENLAITEIITKNEIHVIPLSDLTTHLINNGYFDIRMKNDNHQLRFYHYVRDNSHFYMFFNEGLNSIEECVSLPFSDKYLFLDIMQNKAVLRTIVDGTVRLSLSPYQSSVIVFANELDSFPADIPLKNSSEAMLTGPFEICLSSHTVNPVYETYKENSVLINITSPDELPDFSGNIRYTTNFPFIRNGVSCMLDLGFVGETARVSVNGTNAGIRICLPYLFDVTHLVRDGDNLLQVEVSNTLAYRLKDHLSRFLPLPPSGMIGPVRIVQYQ